MDFVQARWFKPGRKGHKIRLFVIHDMEAPEKTTTAESVAQYFSTADRPASAHFCVDSNSAVQCVHDGDTAYGAAGANLDGLHFEQAGYARQSEAEWLDSFGLAMFEQVGKLLRAKSDLYDVPLRWLTVAQVADGVTKGVCTHGDVSSAFPKVSTGHTDPGPNFPKDKALAIWLGQQEDDDVFKMELWKIEKGADAGQIWLIGLASVEHVQQEELPELERAWGKHKTVPGITDNAVAWDHIKTNAAVKDH